MVHQLVGREGVVVIRMAVVIVMTMVMVMPGSASATTCGVPVLVVVTVMMMVSATGVMSRRYRVLGGGLVRKLLLGRGRLG